LTGEALEKAWQDRAGATPLTPLMAFGADGLTLGAGTVLAPLEDLRSEDPETRRGRVIFDDCQRKTGMMAEAKGPTFSKFLDQKINQCLKREKCKVLNRLNRKLIRQAYLQVGAAKLNGNRPITWFVQNKPTADFVQKKFMEHGNGLEKIMIRVLP
jgi:hypothetical protein